MCQTLPGTERSCIIHAALSERTCSFYERDEVMALIMIFNYSVTWQAHLTLYRALYLFYLITIYQTILYVAKNRIKILDK